MKRIFVLFFAVIILLACVSCDLVTKYEDTNGDADFTLQTITDQQLIDGSISTFENGSFGSNLGGKLNRSVKELNGIVTLETYSSLFSKHYVFHVDLTVKKGNFKLVLCNDEEILHVFENNLEGQVYEFDAKGNVYLRCAGESADFEVTVSVD